MKIYNFHSCEVLKHDGLGEGGEEGMNCGFICTSFFLYQATPLFLGQSFF